MGEGYNRINKKKRRIGIVITIWQEMTIQGLYCYLDMGYNTVMYYKIEMQSCPEPADGFHKLSMSRGTGGRPLCRRPR